MSEDHPSPPAPKSWFARLGQAFSGEPRSREELIEELRTAQANGLLSNDTLSMLEGAIEVSELQVSDVMVPRAQMVSVSVDTALAEILDIALSSGHSRFPAHGEDKDDILGVLLAKDLLQCFVIGAPACDIRALVRPVVLIPESKRLNILLKDFRQSRNHMAIVVDEYGGVAGLITIEDVLEQIVGEIDDEHDNDEAPSVVQQSDGSFIADARASLEDVKSVVGEEFDTGEAGEEVDTLGGYLVTQVGRLPVRGEVISGPGDFEIEVLDADPRRVKRVRIGTRKERSNLRHRETRRREAAADTANPQSNPSSNANDDRAGNK